VRAVVDGTAGWSGADGPRLHAVLSSALARFPLPQWQRLAASLNTAAQDVGLPAQWR
jgi:hypothetical protein